jgi:chorismate synthase
MNSFGTIFRIHVFGESHGPGVGVTIDGCPPGIPLAVADLLPDLARRKSGAKGTTPRMEDDMPEFFSGIYNGHTTGAPISILFRNTNVQSKDYEALKDTLRPGHADFTAHVKFKGFADPRGGGHFSGRLTLCLVAAGLVAKKICAGMAFSATLLEAGGSTDIHTSIDAALAAGDSIGGLVECRVSGIPAGLGEPFFNSIESTIGHLAFSIPAIKGVEFGSGFAAAAMRGSAHNDVLINTDGTTATNHAGWCERRHYQRQRTGVPPCGEAPVKHWPCTADHQCTHRADGHARSARSPRCLHCTACTCGSRVHCGHRAGRYDLIEPLTPIFFPSSLRANC